MSRPLNPLTGNKRLLSLMERMKMTIPFHRASMFPKLQQSIFQSKDGKKGRRV